MYLCLGKEVKLAGKINGKTANSMKVHLSLFLPAESPCNQQIFYQALLFLILATIGKRPTHLERQKVNLPSSARTSCKTSFLL